MFSTPGFSPSFVFREKASKGGMEEVDAKCSPWLFEDSQMGKGEASMDIPQ